MIDVSLQIKDDNFLWKLMYIFGVWLNSICYKRFLIISLWIFVSLAPKQYNIFKEKHQLIIKHYFQNISKDISEKCL